ncbi:MAG: histidine--tRNA ligase [Bacilli bacterium]|nr:histidine--tRNA ligase [Bacilli bacterium]
MSIHRPRGTNDFLPDEVKGWQYVEALARDICRRFGVQEIRTPIFEHTELFLRGVGETTDIVSKEMYTFEDRGGRSITLRPEGTAGVVRSVIENKLYAAPLPLKLYYMGPMFRYEKPQAGRYRQLHQFGVEYLGSDQPSLDAEAITLAMTVLTELGIQNLSLQLNSVGCPACRAEYRKRLMDFLADVKDSLCENCQLRYEKNPMRILDCKVEHDQEATKNAPVMLDCLCEQCALHFASVQKYLQAAGVPFAVNPRIVRGLDYYTQTAFEIIESGTTIIGGGRYNGLAEQLDGPALSGIGFGAGLERILLALQSQQLSIPDRSGLDVYVVALGEEADLAAASLVMDLRKRGLSVDKDYLGRGIKAQFKAADRSGARSVVILGEQELAQGAAAVKNMQTGEQVNQQLAELADYLLQLRG